MKKKIIKIIKWCGITFILLIIIGITFPTWTPKISGEQSISELKHVKINNTALEVMIRGNNIENPVIIFLHGGPCVPEIPYVRKYQDLLEQDFTIVHYDQRGSGKSYDFGTDYSNVTASTHVDDAIALTKYIKEYLHKEQVILIGHSYGTYIATMAAANEPALYEAYIGIGQMSNTIEGELDGLSRCIDAAQKAKNEKDVTYLKSLKEKIAKGEAITPRQYVRKYGFAARNINENADELQGVLFGSEYNLLEIGRASCRERV